MTHVHLFSFLAHVQCTLLVILIIMLKRLLLGNFPIALNFTGTVEKFTKKTRSGHAYFVSFVLEVSSSHFGRLICKLTNLFF